MVWVNETYDIIHSPIFSILLLKDQFKKSLDVEFFINLKFTSIALSSLMHATILKGQNHNVFKQYNLQYKKLKNDNSIDEFSCSFPYNFLSSLVFSFGSIHFWRER